MTEKRLREKAQAILRDHAVQGIGPEIERGELDIEALLEELHVYHAELLMQNESLRQAEGEVEQSQVRFDRLYSGLPLAAFVVDDQDAVRQPNAAARELLALDHHLLPHLAAEESDRGPLRAALERARTQGRGQCRGLSLRGAGGRTLVADLHFLRLPPREDGPGEIVCNVIDQTEQARHARALEEANRRLTEEQERYRILALFAPDWEYWMGGDGTFLYVSPACERVTGYPAADFLEDPGLMIRIVHPEDRPLYEAHAHSRDRGGWALLRFRILTRGGEVRRIEHDCRAVHDEEGRYRGHRGTNRDITARWEAEDAMRRNEAVLTQLLDNVPDVAIQGFDPDGTVFYWNAASARLFGYTAEEAVGASLLDLVVPPQRRDAFAARLREIARTGHPEPSGLITLRHRDGHPLTIYFSKTAVHYPGEALRIFCMNIDLTERNRDRERLWEAVRGGNVGLFEWRPGNRIYLSPELKAQLGYLDHELDSEIGVLESLMHADDMEAVRRRFGAFIRHPVGRFRAELRMRHKEGGWRWILYQASPVHDPEGRLSKILGSSLDITERKQAEETSERLAYAVEQSPSVVVLTDTDGVIEYVNRHFCEITGFTSEEVIGQRPALLRYGEKNVAKYRDLWQTLARGETWEGEFNNRKRNGEPYWEEVRISPIRNARGEVTHYIKLAEDISDKKALSERLEYLAFHDPLTGLPNRALMMDRISQALAQARRDRHPLAVVFIDLDDFKVVNDSLGHSQGDRLLVRIGERLRALLREGDTLARFGGDEFILLLSRLEHIQDAIRVVEQIQTALAPPVDLDGKEVAVSVSIGVAFYPNDSDGPEELVRHADAAMYRAKAEGRRCYHFYTPEMDSALRDRLELDQSMRRALEQGEFFLVYQPRVDLASGRTLSLEALVRWRHPEQGLISPGRFIPLAEETGFILSLGPEVLRQACRQIRQWKASGLEGIPVAVNLSAREFRQPDIFQRIMEILEETGVTPADVEIEITESAAMACIEDTIRIITQLNDRGLRISIDDFGTAYSSLNYLKRLPVHAVKIDQSFVADLQEDPAAHPEDAAIIRAIIGLGETLGLQVIAEGVENTVQRDFLTAHGCYTGQGFLFSRPLEAGAILEYLGGRRGS
ncbi:bifunctional diguanylate cyclase/phosphodiesterase [Ectothiorhodospira mobilis]|uniref:bifunctional diguanylate cyclase/phosphodiesterase n=1 Tax=Ectothiorhodospira mobilis TaxID=195064 RepID=UPI00116066F4|nr:EAL domain-containing protein [Ectothiorhodospira mobilis]